MNYRRATINIRFIFHGKAVFLLVFWFTLILMSNGLVDIIKEAQNEIPVSSLNCSYAYNGLIDDSLNIEGNNDLQVATVYFFANCKDFVPDPIPVCDLDLVDSCEVGIYG